jgi:Tol biopolymer transport system component
MLDRDSSIGKRSRRTGLHVLGVLVAPILVLAAANSCSSDATTASSSGAQVDVDASTDAATGSFLGTLSYAAFGMDGHTHIFSSTGDGVITQLTTGPGDDETAEWSPDGSRLVFQRSDATGVSVFVMNADGSGLTKLSDSGRDVLPGFSADGTKIVFSYVVDPTGCNGGTMPLTRVMTMSSVDGSGRTTLVDGAKAATCFNVEPRFAPDGSKVVFMCGPMNGTIQACTANADGSGYAAITNTKGTVTGDPHWSWDSKKLGISHRDASGNVNVWTMNADGSNLFQVTHFADPVEGGDVGWSPDDTLLAFEQDIGGMGQSVPNAPANVSIIRADGTGYAALNLPCSDKGCAPRFRP